MRLDFNATIVLLISLVKCAAVFGTRTSVSHPLLSSLFKTAKNVKGSNVTPIVSHRPSISSYNARRYLQNFPANYPHKKTPDHGKKTITKHRAAIPKGKRLGLPKQRKVSRLGTSDPYSRVRPRRQRCWRCSIYGKRIVRYRNTYSSTGHRRPFGPKLRKKPTRRPVVTGYGRQHVGLGKKNQKKASSFGNANSANKPSIFYGRKDSVIPFKTKGPARQSFQLSKAIAKQKVPAQLTFSGIGSVPTSIVRNLIKFTNKNAVIPTQSLSEQTSAIIRNRPFGEVGNRLHKPRVLSSSFPAVAFGANTILPSTNHNTSPQGNERTIWDKTNPNFDKLMHTKDRIGTRDVQRTQNTLSFDVNTPDRTAVMQSIFPREIPSPLNEVANNIAYLNSFGRRNSAFNGRSFPVNAIVNNGQIDTRQSHAHPIPAVNKQTDLQELNNILSVNSAQNANADLINPDKNNDIVKNPSIIPSLNVIGDILQSYTGTKKGIEKQVAINSFDKPVIHNPNVQRHSTVNNIPNEGIFNNVDGFFDTIPDNTNIDQQHSVHIKKPAMFNDGVQSSLVDNVNQDLVLNQPSGIINTFDKIQTKTLQQHQDGFIENIENGNVLQPSFANTEIPNAITNLNQNEPLKGQIDQMSMDQGLNKLDVTGETVDNTPTEIIPDKADLWMSVLRDQLNYGDTATDASTEHLLPSETTDGFIDVIPNNADMGSKMILDQSTSFTSTDQIVDQIQNTNTVDEVVNLLMKRPVHGINDNIDVHGRSSLSIEARPSIRKLPKKNINIHSEGHANVEMLGLGADVISGGGSSQETVPHVSSQGKIVPNEPLISDNVWRPSIDSSRIVVDSVVPSLMKNGNGILSVEPIGVIPHNSLSSDGFPSEGHTTNRRTDIQHHENTVHAESKDNVQLTINSNEGFTDIISEIDNKLPVQMKEQTNLNTNVNTNDVIRNNNHMHQIQHIDIATSVKSVPIVGTSNDHNQHHVTPLNTHDMSIIHDPENKAVPNDVKTFGLLEKIPMTMEENIGQVPKGKDPSAHIVLTHTNDDTLRHPSQNVFETNVDNGVPHAEEPNIFKQTSVANGDVGVAEQSVTNFGNSMTMEENIGQVPKSTDPSAHIVLTHTNDDTLRHPSQNVFETNVDNGVPHAEEPIIFKQTSVANNDVGVAEQPKTNFGNSNPADIVRNLLNDAHSFEIIDLRNNPELTRENIVDLLSVNNHEDTAFRPENHVLNEITQNGDNIVNEAIDPEHSHTGRSSSSSHTENHSQTHQHTLHTTELHSTERISHRGESGHAAVQQKGNKPSKTVIGAKLNNSIKPIVASTHTHHLPGSHIGSEPSHETGGQMVHSNNEPGVHFGTDAHSEAHDLHNTLTLHKQANSHTHEHNAASQVSSLASKHFNGEGHNTQSMINSGQSITHTTHDTASGTLLRFEDLIAEITQEHAQTNGGHSAHTIEKDVAGQHGLSQDLTSASQVSTIADTEMHFGGGEHNTQTMIDSESAAHFGTEAHAVAHDLHNTLTLHRQDNSHAHNEHNALSQVSTIADTEMHSGGGEHNAQTMINSEQSTTHTGDNVNDILLRFEDLIAGMEPHTQTNNGGHSAHTVETGVVEQHGLSHGVQPHGHMRATGIQSIPSANNHNTVRDTSAESGVVPRNVDELFNLLSSTPSNNNILVSADVLRMLVNAEIATTSDISPIDNALVNDLPLGTNVAAGKSFRAHADTRTRLGNTVRHAMNGATFNEVTDVGQGISTTTTIDKLRPNGIVAKANKPRMVGIADHAFRGEMRSTGDINLHTHHGIMNGNEFVTNDISVLDVTNKKHKEAHIQGDRSTHEHLDGTITSPFGKDDHGKKKI